MGFPGGTVVKNLPANIGDTGDIGSIPESGRSPGEGNGNSLQYSCLGNPMDRGAWWATVHGGHKESAMTKHTHTPARAHTHTRTHTAHLREDGLFLPSVTRWPISALSQNQGVNPRGMCSPDSVIETVLPPLLQVLCLPAQLALGSPVLCCQGTRIVKGNWKSRFCWCKATAGVRGAALIRICPLKCCFSSFPAASLKIPLHVSASFQVTDRNVRPESQAILSQFYLRKPCSREA